MVGRTIANIDLILSSWQGLQGEDFSALLWPCVNPVGHRSTFVAEAVHRPPLLRSSTRYSRHRAPETLLSDNEQCVTNNAVAQGVDEHVELTMSGRFEAMEALLAVVIFGIDAIEKQRMKMYVKIQRRAEALDKRHRTCLCIRLGVARFLNKVSGKSALADTQDLAHQLWMASQQEP